MYFFLTLVIYATSNSDSRALPPTASTMVVKYGTEAACEAAKPRLERLYTRTIGSNEFLAVGDCTKSA